MLGQDASGIFASPGCTVAHHRSGPGGLFDGLTLTLGVEPEIVGGLAFVLAIERKPDAPLAPGIGPVLYGCATWGKRLGDLPREDSFIPLRGYFQKNRDRDVTFGLLISKKGRTDTSMAEISPQSSDKMSRLALLWGQAKPAVHAYVRSVVRNHHDAEDVIQTTVSRLAERFDDYDASRPFVAWALGFARHIVMEYRNNSYRRPLLLGDAALETLSHAIDDASARIDERYEALEHCVGRLSDHHQSLLTQRYRHDASRQEIASRLNVKENTVSVTLRRIRQALADCVTQHMGGEPR